MDRPDLTSMPKPWGIISQRDYMAEAFSRNIGIFSPSEQQKLSSAKIAIPGLGGVGGIHLITMVRTGIGAFHLANFESCEPANINRQYGARIPDMGRSKLEVMTAEKVRILSGKKGIKPVSLFI